MTLEMLLGVAFTLGWAPLFVFRTEDLTESFASYDPGERLWVIATPVVFSLHIAASCTFLSSGASPPMPRLLASAVLFLTGISFWFWARTAICPLHVRRLPEEPPVRLRRDGAFGLVRNPLYFGMLLAAAAPALAAGRAALGVTYAACIAAMVVRSLQDERRLREQLGVEYEDYSRAVKRLVPFLW